MNVVKMVCKKKFEIKRHCFLGLITRIDISSTKMFGLFTKSEFDRSINKIEGAWNSDYYAQMCHFCFISCAVKINTVYLFLIALCLLDFVKCK